MKGIGVEPSLSFPPPLDSLPLGCAIESLLGAAERGRGGTVEDGLGDEKQLGKPGLAQQDGTGSATNSRDRRVRRW